MNQPEIIANRIITPDGTILQSFNRHDFVSHTDKNGHTYSVDGGLDYLKRSWSHGAPRATEASVFDDSPHEVIREVLSWGSYGKDGSSALTWIKLKDMETDHIEACLRTQARMRTAVKRAMQTELKFRSENGSGTRC